MRVLIIGGGIAGLSLGMFLQRAGFEAQICEARTQAAQSEGAFLTLAPNGVHVLEQLGLKAAIAEASAPTLGMHFSNARGEPVGTIDNRDCHDRYGSGLLTIERATLLRTLQHAAAERGIVVQPERRLTSLSERTDRVEASFEAGDSASAELLIGCDGLRSRVRELCFPDARKPQFTGLFDFGGITEARGDEPLEPGWFHMVFGRRAFFGALLGRGRVYWFHNGGTRPQGDTRAHLLASHDGDPAFIRGLISRTPQILGPWPQHDILSLRRWHHGRVALIGDAAHATTPSAGQGASLALEDALLLARCLRDAPATAFAQFEALRRVRVERIVKASRRHGSGKAPATAAGAWFRDRMLATFLKFGASAQHEAIGYRADFA